jgi:hypothetical protein
LLLALVRLLVVRGAAVVVRRVGILVVVAVLYLDAVLAFALAPRGRSQRDGEREREIAAHQRHTELRPNAFVFAGIQVLGL